MSSIDYPRPVRPARARPAADRLGCALREGWFALLLRLPWPVTLLLLTLLLPPSASFYMGGLRLTAYRLVLLIFFLPSLTAVLSKRCGGVHLCDILMIGHVLWVLLALMVVHDIGQGLQTGGIYIVEALGSYMIARRYIRDARTFGGLVAMWTLIVLLLLPLTMPEAITGYHYMQPGAESTGRRMGLERAYGPFDHPILLGCFCAMTLGISWYVLAGDRRLPIGRLSRLAAIVTSTAMSVSSGAVAFLTAQLIGIGWDRLTKRIPRRWWYLVALLVALYIAVDLTSNRTPMTVALYYLTFNADTAYGRMLIWDCGTAEVWRHPLFGIGMHSWQHPTWISDSIDNFWLATTMLYGLPAIITLGGALAFIIIRLIKRKSLDVATAACRMGWLTSFAGLFVAGCTVYFWNSSLVAVMLFFGSSVWMVGDRRPMPMKVRAGRPTAASVI